MSPSPTNPDRAPDSPPALSPPSPSSPLPPLSPHNQSLLTAYINARFDIPAFTAAANLSARQLADFAADPAIQAHIDSMMSLARRSLYLRASQARHTAITTLEAIAEKSEDEVEKRRAASQLLRATSAPITGSCSSSQPSTQRDEQDQDDTDPPPRPRAQPHASFSAQQVAKLLGDAFTGEDAHDAHSGAATIAAFSDIPALIDEAPLSSADPDDEPVEYIEDIESSALAPYLKAQSFKVNPAAQASETEATFNAVLNFFDTNPYNLKPESRRRLTLSLARRADSRRPDCWLLRAITLGPPTRSKAPANTS